MVFSRLSEACSAADLLQASIGVVIKKKSPTRRTTPSPEGVASTTDQGVRGQICFRGERLGKCWVCGNSVYMLPKICPASAGNPGTDGCAKCALALNARTICNFIPFYANQASQARADANPPTSQD
jgi:hypothetical protein